MYARDILTKDTYKYQLELFKQNMQKGEDPSKPSIMRGKMINKNGEIVWGEAHARIIYNKRGEPTGAFGVLRDISERIKTERELIESEKKLSLIAENSEDMIYATDLNQRFTYVSPSVRKLLGYTIEEAMELNVKDIMTEASYQHQSNLFERDLKELEDFSNASAIIQAEMVRKDGSTFWGETYARIMLNEEKQPQGIFGICRDITLQKEKEKKLIQAKEKAEEKGLDLEYYTDKKNDNSVVLIDNGKLQQILFNLLSNALKFTSEGKVSFGYSNNRSHILFYVKDTGLGISDSQKHKVFQRFLQAENKNNKKFKGTGLGLSISKALVELMEGRIWHENNNSNGSVFYFTLPYENAQSKS